MIGTFQEFPSEASAQKAVAALRANGNAETSRTQIDAISFHTLSQHYREKEMCEDAGKTLATNRTNEGYLDRWILPRWSSYRLRDVKAVIVEEWLRSLPLANGSKAIEASLKAAGIDYRRISFAGTNCKDMTEYMIRHPVDDLVRLIGPDWVHLPNGKRLPHVPMLATA